MESPVPPGGHTAQRVTIRRLIPLNEITILVIDEKVEIYPRTIWANVDCISYVGLEENIVLMTLATTERVGTY